MTNAKKTETKAAVIKETVNEITKVSEAAPVKEAVSVKEVAPVKAAEADKAPEPVKTAAPKRAADPKKEAVSKKEAAPKKGAALKKEAAPKKEAPVKKEAPSKKAAAPTNKAVKANVYVQYLDKEISAESLVAEAKKAYAAAGNKVADIKSIDVYVKPEENTAYYAVNGNGAPEFKFNL